MCIRDSYTRKLLLWAYISMGICNGGILLFLKPLVGIYALSGETMALAILLVQIHAGSGLFLWPASFVPVSYTHLDVYKRQALVASMSFLLKRTMFAPLVRAVSDVYKRQRHGIGADGLQQLLRLGLVGRVSGVKGGQDGTVHHAALPDLSLIHI